jgi:hypothetical protein
MVAIMSRSADRRATVVRAAVAYDGVLSRSLLADPAGLARAGHAGFSSD